MVDIVVLMSNGNINLPVTLTEAGATEQAKRLSLACPYTIVVYQNGEILTTWHNGRQVTLP